MFTVGRKSGTRGTVSVGRNESGERLNEMASWTIEARLVARLHVAFRAAPPFFAARNEFEFDDALRTVEGGHRAVEILRSEWHVHAHGFLERFEHFRLTHHLREV